MTPLIIIGINLALIPIMVVCLRLWLRGNPDALTAQYRLCTVLMWTGVLIGVAATIISFAASLPISGLLIASTGLLMVTSMSLRRNQLSRLLAERQKNNVV